MRFVSLFAGIGGFDLGLERAGHECIGQVEIDKHAQGVLTRHWPDVPRHDDVRTAVDWANRIGLVGRTDLVCGGFPCQDVSRAGKRAGLAGERSGLFWDALTFATHVEAGWFVLENVPGLLSSNDGEDFGVVISAMADSGYRHIEWRVLDSQFFGVPQRRRRVFIVGRTSTDGGRQVFVEREGLRWNPETFYPQGQGSAGSSGRSVEGLRDGPDATDGIATHTHTDLLGRDTDKRLSGREHVSERADDAGEASYASRNHPTQPIVGTICQGAHPGSYNGQDAYAGLLIPYTK